MFGPTILSNCILFLFLIFSVLVNFSTTCIPSAGQIRCIYCTRPAQRPIHIHCDCSTYSGTPLNCASECSSKEIAFSYGRSYMGSYEPVTPPPVVTTLIQGNSRQIKSKEGPQASDVNSSKPIGLDLRLQELQHSNMSIIKLKTSMVKHTIPIQQSSSAPTPAEVANINPISSTIFPIVYPVKDQEFVKMDKDKEFTNYDNEMLEIMETTIPTPCSTSITTKSKQSEAYGGVEDSTAYSKDQDPCAQPADHKVEPAQVYYASQPSAEPSRSNRDNSYGNDDRMDRIEFITNGQMYRRYFHKICRGIQLGSSVEQSTKKAIHNCERMIGCSALNLRTLNSELKVEAIYMKDIHSTMRTQSGYDCLEILNNTVLNVVK